MHKKNLKKSSIISVVSLSLILLFTMLFTPIVQAQPQDDVNTSDAYQYPILPGSDEWKAFTTNQQMIDVCQVPQDILVNMSTKGLVETVLSNPLIECARLYDDIESGFTSAISRFNSVQELFSREDASIEILTLYVSFDPLALNKNWTDVRTLLLSDKLQNIELLLSQDTILDKLSNEQCRQIIEATQEKSRKLQANPDRLDRLDGLIMSSLIEKVSGRLYSERRTQTLDETPNGTEYLIWVMNPLPINMGGDELLETTKQQMEYFIYLYYPQVSILRRPTAMYNCHSYAWKSQSQYSQWVIDGDEVDAYWEDGSYTQYTGTPYAGLKARYVSDDHSAIVISVSGGVVYVTSKWGEYGLYNHAANYGYDGTTLYYYYR